VTPTQRDHASALRQTHGVRPGDVVFLGAGQLVKKKRFDDVIRALASANAPNAILWLAGTGNDEQNLKSLADQLGVADRVHFLGWLQPAQVEIAFLAADVFVHPAARDPFPTVVLDAMTWGKPIIGSEEAGSVADRVVMGRNGFVHRPGDVDAIAQHMCFFAASPEQISTFGAEARKTACEYPVDLGLRLVSQLGVVDGA
jgi:1,2-diacylglycerol 3-alpha-glucosyltransferase